MVQSQPRWPEHGTQAAVSALSGSLFLWLLWFLPPRLGWDLSHPKDIAYAALFYIGFGATVMVFAGITLRWLRPRPVVLRREQDQPAALEVRIASPVPWLVALWCAAIASALLLPNHFWDTSDGGRRSGIPLGVALLGFIGAALYMLLRFPSLRPVLLITEEGVAQEDGRTRGTFTLTWAEIESIEQRNRQAGSVMPIPRIVFRVRESDRMRNHEIQGARLLADPHEVLRIVRCLHEMPELRARIGEISTVDDLFVGHEKQRIERQRQEIAARRRAREQVRAATSVPTEDRATQRAAPPVVTALLWILVPASVAVLLYLAAQSREDRAEDDTTAAAPGGPTGDFAALVEEIRTATGDTRVFWVEEKPTYTIIMVPAEPGTTRMVGYTRFGGVLTQAAAGEEQGRPFELERVDAAAVDRLCGGTGIAGCRIRITRMPHHGDRVVIKINGIEYDRKGRPLEPVASR